MCERVRSASSASFREMLVTVEAGVAARVMQIKQALAEQWCAIVADKFQFWLHVPHKCAGGFAQYQGYSKLEGKRCISECFDEWHSMEDKDAGHRASFQLFDNSSVVSLQLHAFMSHPDSELHDYPEAFEEVQDRSLGSLVGRLIESEHKTLRYAMTRGSRYTKPAVACARERKNQTLELLADATAKDWVVKEWHTRSHWRRLLEHVMPKDDVFRATPRQLHSRVYQYSAEDLFQDRSEMSDNIVAWSAAQVAASAPALRFGLVDGAFIQYVKGRCASATLLSMPRALWDLCTSETAHDLPEPLDDVAELSSVGVVAALQDHPDNLPHGAALADDIVLFEVVDARPERRTQVRMGHIARNRTSMCVMRYEVGRRDADSLNLELVRGCKMFDISRMCTAAKAEFFLQNLCRWDTGGAGRQISFVPPRALPRPPLQPQVEDEEPSSAVVPVLDRLEPEISTRALRMGEELVLRRAFAENGAFVDVWELQDFDIVAIRELHALGVLEVRTDDFGENQYAVLLEAMRVEGGVAAERPVLDLRVSSPDAECLKMSKMEVVLYLGQSGWTFSEAAPPDLLPGVHVCPPSNLLRPLAYWQCMAKSDEVFLKPGGLQHIYQFGTDSYYKCLLRLDDLGPVVALGAVAGLPDKVFKDLLGALAPRPVQEERMLDDHDCDDDDHAAARRAAEPPPLRALPFAPPAPPLVPPAVLERPVALSVDNADLIVSFDTLHNSGFLRAYITCKAHTSGGSQCRLYRFPHTFPSRNECVAYLMAWAVAADSTDRLAHMGAAPPLELVRRIHALLPP